ncbi:hypothetical protein GCM10022245_28450 [Streptomyces mayteni]
MSPTSLDPYVNGPAASGWGPVAKDRLCRGSEAAPNTLYLSAEDVDMMQGTPANRQTHTGTRRGSDSRVAPVGCLLVLPRRIWQRTDLCSEGLRMT